MDEDTKCDIAVQWNGVLLSHKNEILIHIITWRNLKAIMLSERGQNKSPHIFIPLVHVPVWKSLEMENRLMVARSWGKAGVGHGNSTGMKMF